MIRPPHKRSIAKPAKRLPGAQSLKAKGRRAPVRKPMEKLKSAPLLSSLREENLERGAEKEIVRLHKSFQETILGYRQGLRRIIASGCVVAAFLEANDEAWSAFCSHRIWKGRTPKPDPQESDQALRFVLLRISGLSKAGIKRASKWHKAVRPLVERGVSPKDIPRAIKEGGGIESLARRSAQARKSKSTTRTAPEKKLPAGKKKKGAAIRRGPATEIPTFVDLRARLVEDGKEFLGLPMDACARLTIRMRGSEGSKFEIAILDVKRIPPPPPPI
jgi:hypothetical protein